MGSGPQSSNRDGGVDVELAGEPGRENHRQGEDDLARLRIPVLLNAGNPHERLYVAGMDGTGNSMFDDKPEHWSVVAKIYEQIETKKPAGIAAGYVEGTFTQNGILKLPEKLWDGRFGHTFEDRVETAYFQLCEQAKKWIDEDPEAQIRIAGVGYSRGGEGSAALERMVHERGIRDPLGAQVTRDDENLVTRIQYADRPLLVQPGRTAQVALLIDPVQTGVEEHDRRLPPSTLTTLQLTAQHERRDSFKSTLHVPIGFSEDDRSLNLVRWGGHGNMADVYGRNGLGTQNFNLAVEFLNRLSDRPYLEERALSEDPEQYVIHRTDQHMWGLYGTRGYDRDGVRDYVDSLAPDKLCHGGVVEECRRKAPIDEALDAQFERRTGPSVRASAQAEDLSVAHASDRSTWPGLNEIVEQVSRAGANAGNGGGLMPAVVDEYLRGPWARQFQAEIARELAAREVQPPASPAVPAQDATRESAAPVR